MMSRVLIVVFTISCVVPGGYFSLVLPGQCVGQSISPQQEIDYESLAVDSILDVAQEAAKLPDIEQKVALLINAAKLLQASRRDDAIHLLDIALGALKDWGTSEKAGWGQRYTAARLRSEVLSAYARLDSKKAAALQKESAAKADSGASEGNETARPLRNQDWSVDMLERHQHASAAAKIALSTIDTDFERASALVVQSVRGGVVSSEIYDIFQKLKQNSNRAPLDKLETRIGEALSQTFTLDPSSLQFASILIQSGRDMPPAARNGFILFLMNSLRTWVNLVRDESGSGSLDPSYVGSTFTSFVRSVRPAIFQYLPPEELSNFDLLLDQVSPLLSAQTKARLKMTSAETISDPRDLLADILKESNTRQRDIRLMRFALGSVRNSAPDDLIKGLEFASDSISRISDERLKVTLNDFIAITRMNLLAKEKKFTDAERLAESISTPETRSWTMIALSSVIQPADRTRAFQLIGSAIKTLDGAAPSARKVELALLAVSMLVKDNPLRALEVLSVAAKYANSKLPTVEIPDNDILSAIKLEASIGSMSTVLSRAPESLAEIEINPALSLLGEAKYWFQSQPIVSDFRESELRLLLKLKLAEGALARNLKQKKDVPQKTSLK
jgi:hypothetical protein